MRGFEISTAGQKLVSQFPVAEALRELLPTLQDEELMSFLRLWVSEGIPFAFRERPLVYECVRSWIGYRLQVEPRNITIIGSGRLGFSLSSGGAFGKPYGNES